MRVVAVAIAGVGSSLALAKPVVIYDSGATQPIAPFMTVFGDPQAAAPGQRTDDPGVTDLARLLPIRSPGLTPGPVVPRPLPLASGVPMLRPLFLIGADGQSHAWLIQHRARLKVLGAVGMLVQADSLADLEAIAGIAEGLPILPASAADVARVLGLSHYPALISRAGIEQ